METTVADKAVQLLALFRAAGEDVSQSATSLEWLFHVDEASVFVAAIAELGRAPSLHLSHTPSETPPTPPGDDYEAADLEAEIHHLKNQTLRQKHHSSSLITLIKSRERTLESVDEQVESTDLMQPTHAHATPRLLTALKQFDTVLDELATDWDDVANEHYQTNNIQLEEAVAAMVSHLQSVREQCMAAMDRSSVSSGENEAQNSVVAYQNEIHRIIAACGMAEEARVVGPLRAVHSDDNNKEPAEARPADVPRLRNLARALGEQSASLAVELDFRDQKRKRQDRQRVVQSQWIDVLQGVEETLRRLVNRLAEREFAVRKLASVMEAGLEFRTSNSTRCYINSLRDGVRETPRELYLRIVEGVLFQRSFPKKTDLPAFADVRNIYGALSRVDKQSCEIERTLVDLQTRIVDSVVAAVNETVQAAKGLFALSVITPHPVVDGIRESEVALRQVNETVGRIGRQKDQLLDAPSSNASERARRATWAALLVAPDSIQTVVPN